MADTNTTEAAATPAKPKIVKSDMDSRRLFDSTVDATAYLAKCGEDYTDFSTTTIAAAGLTEEGEFDPAVYTDQMQVAVAVLTERGEGVGSSTVKAIVVYPSPRVSALMESTAGADWIAGLIAKEANHVAVRNLRKAESDSDLADAIQTMPTTIENYTTQLPSDMFLWAGGASIVASATLRFLGRKDDAHFVGQWAPTFLILGLYNKLVKVAGSDRTGRE